MLKIKEIVTVRLQKWKLGAALFVAAFLWSGILWADVSLKVAVILTAVLLVPVWLRIHVQNETVAETLQTLILLLGSAVTFALTQSTMNLSFTSVGLGKWLLNCLMCLMTQWLFLCITGRPRLSVVLSSLLWLCLGTINIYVVEFRGTELFLLDIFAASTAMSVLDQYMITVQSVTVYCWCAWMAFVLWLSMLVFPERMRRTLWIRRGIGAVGVAVVFLLLPTIAANGEVRRWSINGSLNNGMMLNFMMEAKHSLSMNLRDYTSEVVDAVAEDYATDAGSAENYPDLIVVMNESYADFTIYGEIFQPSEDVLPYYRSLKENTAKGYAYSSAFGGGTSNSEFEVLTGNSMGLLPASSVAYQQYFGENSWSVVQYLEQLGYRTEAMHPFYSEGWNRDEVYPAMGFDRIRFLDDFDQSRTVRDYVGDQVVCETILETLEESREPVFLLAVTMQNHGDYEDANYTNSVTLSGLQGYYPDVEQHLTLMKESNSALEYLIESLKTRERDTVVLFFGDHQPRVNPAFYQEMIGESETLADEQKKYMVPYFIWANYDIPEQQMEPTSLNYLGGQLLEKAGIPLPGYFQFLQDLQKSVPVMNGFGYYSAESDCWRKYQDASGTEADLMEQYRNLQCYSLFEEGELNKNLFPG